MRDDFSAKIKERLAKRVGYHCSNCWKQTVGPGGGVDGISLIGVAAHICAAAPGGPRYDEKMSAEERSSIYNGIWLCQNCAHLIDTDTQRYTVDVLQTIKAKAEAKAHVKISLNTHESDITISDELKNHMITNIRIMKEWAKYLRNESDNYHPATIYADDVRIYNVCVDIYSSIVQLVNTEMQNHIQLKQARLDDLIFELRDMIPEFYDEHIDGTGTNMIATTFDYTKFFESDDGGKFIKKCKKLIKAIEDA